MANQGIKTPIDAGIISMVAGGLLETIRGVTGTTWFGPGQPLPPVAPKDQNVRQLDYQFGYNLQLGPRTTESGVSYAQLRALADGYDLLRIIIETRKDQVVAMPWSFRLRPEPGESKQQHAERSSADARIKELNSMFRYPDGEHDWKTWVRAMLEEIFVLDALSIAPQYALDGSILGLDVIDGSTITRKVNKDGRTPKAPSVAYQQELHGLPAKDLTTRDLIYKPRNYRAHRIYGYGPVEQIIITVNMALRRQQTQLSHFTEGNIPESIAQVPETWTPGDIKQLQEMFDAMAGNLAKKSRIRFIPKLDGLLFPKEKMLVDQFDEWLARIVCFCFSISPQPFTKMMNRATAKNASESAMIEGLVPILDYISGVLTMICEKYMGLPDIEHAFLEDEEADKLKQAQIDKIYATYGKESIDEQRERDGQDPIGIGPMVFAATGPIPLAPFLDGGPMADGLPANAKSPDEIDAEKEQDKKDALAAAPAPGAPAGSTEKLRKVVKKKYL